jgi:hypothetical protein
MLTSYLKSVAAGPQQLQLNVKRQNGGKAEGKKGYSAFLTKSIHCVPVSTFLSCQSGGAAEGPKKPTKKLIFVEAVTKTGDSVWPGRRQCPTIPYVPIGHEGFVGLSVSKEHISATRWRLFTLTAVALRFCRAIEKTPSIG